MSVEAVDHGCQFDSVALLTAAGGAVKEIGVGQTLLPEGGCQTLPLTMVGDQVGINQKRGLSVIQGR
jgi:hypothetical protein